MPYSNPSDGIKRPRRRAERYPKVAVCADRFAPPRCRRSAAASLARTLQRSPVNVAVLADVFGDRLPPRADVALAALSRELRVLQRLFAAFLEPLEPVHDHRIARVELRPRLELPE